MDLKCEEDEFLMDSEDDELLGSHDDEDDDFLGDEEVFTTPTLSIYSTLLCSAVLYCALLYSIVFCCTLLCSAVLYWANEMIGKCIFFITLFL